jgi:O-methyltransferase
MAARPPEGDARADAIRASLAGAREPRAVGPGPGTEALRSAYLDLLKLCLCDLAGTTTLSVGPRPDGGVVAREMRGDQLRARSVGLDWPLQGLSMSGLRRLDDLQSCVDSVVRERIDGDFIEAGAWRGGATILMRAALDSLGDDSDRTVWVADSFEGFPDADGEGADRDDVGAYLSAFDFLAVSEREVRDNFARLGFESGVRFLRGLFKDTLPDLADRRWAIVRLDGDSYDATHVALESLYPGLSVGGYLIVDDYGAVEECRRAVDEFRRGHGVSEAIEAVDWTCVRWRRGSEAPRAELQKTGEGSDRGVGRLPIAGSGSLSVPTVREVYLGGEVARLRERLAEAEAEISRLREEADELRHGYEQSLSWRITRPLRAGVSMTQSIRSRQSPS